MAAAGRLAGPEWKHYADPATELEVVRLTDPAFSSGMTAPHLRQFTRRGESLLYWSERYSADSPGARQAFLLDLKQGESRQLTAGRRRSTLSACRSLPTSAALCSSTDVRCRNRRWRTRIPARSIEFPKTPCVPASPSAPTARFFSANAKTEGRGSSACSAQQTRSIVDTDQEIEELMARPRHAQILYRTRPEGQFWLVNSDGSGKRQLKTEPGQTGGALWIPSGRTLIYLHIPDDPKELITLRENAPDDGTDQLLAKTSQFISASPNADASVFTGASRSRATAYVLILLRVARRELTLCEHRASDPAMVKPVFSPDSQSVLFVSDRHGKPALYQVHVNQICRRDRPAINPRFSRVPVPVFLQAPSRATVRITLRANARTFRISSSLSARGANWLNSSTVQIAPEPRSESKSPTIRSTSPASTGSGPRAPFPVVSSTSQPSAIRPKNPLRYPSAVSTA